MKKMLGALLSVALLAVVVPQPASAEVTFDLGLKGGVALTSLKWSDEGEPDNSTSILTPIIGGFLTINVNKTFAFQPEIYFLTLGGKWTASGEGFDLKEVEKIGVVHIPFLAKIRLADREAKKIVPILFAGPAVDVILSAKGKFYVDGALEDEYDIKEDLKSTNFSLVFGGGAEVMLDKLMLVFEARYDMGLTDLHIDVDQVYKTKALIFMVGVGF
jgi:hypothetical protein